MQRLLCLFSSIGFSSILFVFWVAHCLLINSLSLKLQWLVIITFCVPCTTTWKHVISSLWMNTSNIIFWLFCICSLHRYVLMTFHCSPCISFVECVDTFVASADTTNILTSNVGIAYSSFYTLNSTSIWTINSSLLQVILQRIVHHLKFWSWYCFDLKIFHPFFFIAPHLWYTFFIFHLYIKIHLHFAPHILAYVVIIFELQIPCICMVWTYSN